jgi:hypothetical protein
MAASFSFLNIFGFAASTLGIVGFTENNLPVQVPNQTKVRIFAGLGLNSTSGTGGNCPTVALWDGSGGFIGSSGPVVDSIGSGDFVDLDVQPTSATNDRATEYMAVAAAGSDDICIASIALTMPSGDNLVMYGDVPSQCGAPWYHSNEILGNLDFKPRCVWITNTVSKTRPYQGFGIHLPDFVFTEARLAQYNLHDGSMCHAQPRFSMYTQIGITDSIPVFDPPINTNPSNLTDPDPGAVSTAPMTPADPITGLISLVGRPIPSGIDGVATGPSSALNLPVQAPSSGRRRRRQTTDFTSQDQVIISSDPQHSAAELCQSPMSAGPDFVSLSEGLFCDMDEKQLWPLCSSSNATSSCFDTTSNALLIGAPFSNATTGGTLLVTGGSSGKVYSTVTRWD